MPRALLLVADGSEEIEFVTPYDVLTRAGFEVKSVGINLKNGNHAHMSRNLRILPDYPSLSSLPPSTLPAHTYYDILILPGGAPGAKTFCAEPAVLDLVNGFREEGKWVAAICAASTVLVAAEKKTGGEDAGKRRVTSHPSVKSEIVEAGWEYSEDRVVVDGRVITSRGPGTAMGWALEIVERVCGREKRGEVAGPMVVAGVL